MSGRKDGLVLLDKQPGTTSFEALHAVKKKLGTGKVGHAGTLDRFARGLLVALSGRCTRLVPYLMPLEKEYVAILRFGEETDTLDVEGEVVRTGEVPDEETVEEALSRFIGDIEQVPPVFSAVHHNGERAYRLAREGKSPALRPRTVRIESIEAVSFEPPELTLRVRCSKGTYIRALARDIGRSCGSCAYLTSLERTRIGPFTVEEAVAPEAFHPDLHLVGSPGFVDELPYLEVREVPEPAVAGVRYGWPITDHTFEQSPGQDGRYALVTRSRELVALVERENGRYRYLGVFV